MPLFHSIDKQTWDGEWEVIVAVDGCKECTDYLLENQYQFDWLNIYDCPKNMGVYRTINTLMGLAEDDMLIFGSDDVMHPDLIKSLYEVEGDFKQFRFWHLRGEYAGYDHHKTYAAGAVWLNQKTLSTLGGYKDWRYSADSEFVERVKSSDLIHTKIDKELMWYRSHPDNLTATVDLGARARQRAQIKFNGYGKSELYVHRKANSGEFVFDESLPKTT